MDDSPNQTFSPALASDLVETLDRGAIAPAASRRFVELELEVVRELTPEDLLEALESGVDVSGPTSIGAIRHAHHRIAMLIIEGKRPAAISAITGYNPGYISRLQGDPMFRELLAYYASQGEAHHLNVMERVTTLSVTAMEELQSRLEAEPDKFTKKELMEVAKLGVVDAPAAAARGIAQGPAAAPTTVNIQFVSTPAPQIGEVERASRAAIEIIPPEQEI